MRDLAPVQTVQNGSAWVNDVAYLEGPRKLLVASMDRTVGLGVGRVAAGGGEWWQGKGLKGKGTSGWCRRAHAAEQRGNARESASFLAVLVAGDCLSSILSR
jgi:hypothetical protein